MAVPDDFVDELGAKIGTLDFVSHCYQRPRHLPEWPYNLFCMVHGQEREAVLRQIDELAEKCGAAAAGRDVLFSTRRFKQRGARYGKVPEKLESVA